MRGGTVASQELRHVIIYTDGYCKGNPGPGGYGVVIRYISRHWELSGGFRRTTCNRMELMAAIMGLRRLKERYRVTLYTDSDYLYSAMTKGWVRRWRDNGWMKVNKRDKIPNSDLWEELLRLCEQHEVEFIRGGAFAGSGDRSKCVQLVREAAARPDLAIDKGYESAEAKAILS
jgi:ribonuclease HI